MSSRNDIICFANDWAADPLSKKQIMTRLARRHRILWINSINIRRPRLARKDFRRSVQKLREFGRGLMHVEERIWVLSPLYLPFHSLAVVRSLNRWLLRWQIRRALRRLGFADPVTWTYVPNSADVVGTLGERLIVYQCVDEYAAFSDAGAEVRERERDLLAKSDLVLVCSSALLDSKRTENPHTFLITHGVDYEHFRRAVEESTPVAEELRALPRPILGFHGLVADWVDLPLLAELARQRPQWTIVLVGRADTDLAPVRGLSNVHVLGHRPYARLPEYLRGFDVALLPFVYNELTRNANPLKLREYLAAGLPVVATPLPEIAKFDHLVLLATTSDDYVAKITALLEKGMTGPSPTRSETMAEESWDRKVEEAERLLCAALPDDLEHRLREHPIFAGRQLEFVSRSCGRHSEHLEYRDRSAAGERRILVKRIKTWEGPGQPHETVAREHHALEKLREHFDPENRSSLPVPLLALPEANTLVVERLPGLPLSQILKREANRIVGPFRRHRMCAVSRLAAQWLRQFHHATQQPPQTHDSRAYLTELGQRLDRCATLGLDKTAAEEVWGLASRTSWKANQQLTSTAARHGDFIPQNILVHGARLGVVDFENFSECDVIYEDVGTFVAYLTMLRVSPFYSRGTLEAMISSFLATYGDHLSNPLLRLYVVKAAVTIVSEFQPKAGILGSPDRLRQLRKHLLRASHMLLGGVPIHPAEATLAG